MAYDPGAIDATLAAAVGEDPALIAELRLAFHEGAERSFATLKGAPDEATWREAAARLRGLAASFGAVRLMALATELGDAGLRDAKLLAKLERAIARL